MVLSKNNLERLLDKEFRRMIKTMIKQLTEEKDKEINKIRKSVLDTKIEFKLLKKTQAEMVLETKSSVSLSKPQWITVTTE